jgi:hypothetical protein
MSFQSDFDFTVKWPIPILIFPSMIKSTSTEICIMSNSSRKKDTNHFMEPIKELTKLGKNEH